MSTNRSLLNIASNLKEEECYNVVWTSGKWNQNILFNHLFAHAYSVLCSVLYLSLAVAQLLFVMLLCCHTLINIRVIHHAAPSYVVATLGQVTTTVYWCIDRLLEPVLVS